MTAFSTTHAAATYLPEPKPRRSGIALCLSGGGFRASLFHLGALRRLNELGILCQIDTITSVSGGSITSAHLATRLHPWPSSGEAASDWDTKIARPFKDFVARNLRTGPLLERLLPWKWFDSSAGVEALEAAYETRLTQLKLSQLPAHPNLVFCATDMAFGVDWVFERGRVGDYQAGYMSPPPDWPVARAVAASSCFPPVFNPLPISLSPAQLVGGKVLPGPARDECIRSLRLTDGGVYDNMGLEPVWKTHAVVLVSDGGGIFSFEGDKNLIWRIERYTAIQGNQARALRKRWLMSNFIAHEMSGAYFGIGSSTDHYGPSAPNGYSATLIEQRISNIRTDLDAFSEAEIAVLENHGYLMAEAAVRAHTPELVAVASPAAVPNPDWMDPNAVQKALEGSSERKLPFGRF